MRFHSCSAGYLTALSLVSALVLVQKPVCGQTPLNERVLVVFNSSASESRAVAKHYMAQRQIPERNMCRIAVDTVDGIYYEEYESRIKRPIQKCIDAIGKQKILYVVFSYQTPYRLRVGERGFALDQYIADIWDEYKASGPGNEVANHPYFGNAQSQGNVYVPFVPLSAYRESPGAMNIYSVWRLDGANANLAKGLVDKAIMAETYGLTGKGCFDLQFERVQDRADYGSVSGDWDVHQSADFARLAGFPVIEDDHNAEFGTAPAPLRCDGAALYAGWYSLNNYNDAFTWNVGAIGLHLDSASAMNPRGGGNWAASAVMKGITITSGAADEPYLDGLAHPDQVFRYLFQGANAGDALLRSTRWLKWMILNIGDPLYRPFPKGIGPFSSPEYTGMVLALMPQSLVGGNPGFGLAGLESLAPDGGLTISLTTDQPNIVNLPKTITVAEKTIGYRFGFATKPVSENISVRISMSVGGKSRSNTLMVYSLMQSLTLSSAKATGGTPVTGSVRLSQKAPAEGVTVKVSSDAPEVASVPVEIKIPAGSDGGVFQITTRTVTAETKCAITASVGGSTRTTELTLVP